jgi:hypothetical protein
MAQASPVLFSGTGVNGGVTLNASARFAISGNTLTVTLRNAGDSSGTNIHDTPATTLTGVFFDLPSGITLTPLSATIAPNSLVNPGACSVANACSNATTNVGGEFIYGTSASNGPFTGHLGDHGISSSGYISGGAGNFGSPAVNLDGPVAPNGINFGILPDITAANKFNPNGGLANVPLIEEQVVFTLTINGTVNGGPLTEQSISNVSFQYGTAFSEAHFTGGGNSGQGLPEPAVLMLIAPAVVAAARRALNRERSRRLSL